ncbi:MAG: phosphotransferase family protein [Halolamina sp.]
MSGFTSEAFRVRTDGGDAVVIKYPCHAPRVEPAVLERLSLPEAPTVLAVGDGRETSAPCFAMPRYEGTTQPVADYPADVQETLARAVGRFLRRLRETAPVPATATETTTETPVEAAFGRFEYDDGFRVTGWTESTPFESWPAAVEDMVARDVSVARGTELESIARRVAAFLSDRREQLPEAPPAAVSYFDAIGPNLVVNDGRLSAVLDWEGVGVADSRLSVVAAMNRFANVSARREASNREPLLAAIEAGYGEPVRTAEWFDAYRLLVVLDLATYGYRLGRPPAEELVAWYRESLRRIMDGRRVPTAPTPEPKTRS